VTAWDRYREQRRGGAPGAGRRFAREVMGHPLRVFGVIEVLRHRLAVRRRTSRLAVSGEPSVAVLPGADPDAVPEQDRYEVDLSGAGNVRAFLRLARRPSTAAVVSSRLQAGVVRLAGVRSIRALGPAPRGEA
jgi:hypothetical protein